MQQIAEMEIFESSSSLTGGDEGSQPASAPSPESWWGGVWRTQPPRGWEGGTLALVWKISLSLSLTHTPLHTHTHTPEGTLSELHVAASLCSHSLGKEEDGTASAPAFPFSCPYLGSR